MNTLFDIDSAVKRIYDRVLIVHIDSMVYHEYSFADMQPLGDGSYDEYTLSLAQTMAKREQVNFIKKMELSHILNALKSNPAMVKINYTKTNNEITAHYQFQISYLNDNQTELIFFRQNNVADTAAESQDSDSYIKDSKRLMFLSQQLCQFYIEIDTQKGIFHPVYTTMKLPAHSSFHDLISHFCTFVTPEQQKAFLREYDLNTLMTRLHKGSGTSTSIYMVSTSDGQKYYSITCVLVRSDKESEEEYVYCYARDITVLKEEENRNRQLVNLSKQLLDISQSDGLTSLTNHITAESMISEYLNNYEGNHSGTLFLIDIDYFKQINDTYGHTAGDTVLKFFSDALKKIFRSDDIISRWGGDEFLIFMRNVYKRESIQSRIERLLNSTLYCLYQEQKIPFTLSIGIVLANPNERFETLFDRADILLYEAKKRGRNTYLIEE